MKTLITKLSKLSECALPGVACLILGACTGGRPAQPQQVNTPQVGAVESALENPVAQCEEEQATCLGAAADRAAALQCSETFRTCLGLAAETGRQLAQTLEECRETAARCAVEGGAMGAQACRSDYDACVSAAMEEEPAPPAAGAAAPGMPQLPAAGDGAPRLPTPGGPGLPGRRLPSAGAGGIGGLPTLPRRPGFPGAGSVSLPSPGGRGGLPGRFPRRDSSACFEALRSCVEAPNADLNQCATAARECLRSERDPSGSAGTGGSAGAP